jgi:tRNA(adenine34) deaminase
MHHLMRLALVQAQAAACVGEVPVGAIVVEYATGRILTTAHNRTEADCDPTAHAEILCLRAACALKKTPRLPDCDIYVTLEPCAMCAQAISHARFRRLYFGAYDVKSGGVEHGAQVYRHATCHHVPAVYGGILANEAGALLQQFFEQRRKTGSPID